VLIQRVGVCRDSAHLAMALCRALCILACYIAGYTVGLMPPNFHGFFEAALGARWYVCDTTRMAPMNGLARISGGRDAAHGSFASILGAAMLHQMTVSAEVWTAKMAEKPGSDTPAIVAASRRRSMPDLTPEGQQHVTELAQRYGVSVDAVMTLLHALVKGHGTMAQFDHRELGGRGQWMAGGMVMVGDMWNNALKTTVDGLCTALSRLVTPEVFQAQPASSHRQSQRGPHQQRGGVSPPDHGRTPAAVSVFVPSSSGGSEEEWWPADLGAPTTSGSQHTMRYAYFPAKRRLAVAVHGQVTVYDTLDHHVSGVSQQQGAGSSCTFTSQYGVVALHTLPIIASNCPASASPAPTVSADGPAVDMAGSTSRPSPWPPVADAAAAQPMDIFAALERLAELQRRGILSEEEFTTKKAELLRRL